MKLKVSSEKQLLGKLANKYQVDLVGYPLSFYMKGNYLYLIQSGLILGDDSAVKNFISGITKEKEVVKSEFRGDFGIIVTRLPKKTQQFWDARVIRPIPTIINWKSKKHTWELASFDKKALQNIYSLAKKEYGVEMLKLKKEKLKSISITTPFPYLTKKQKQAIKLAISNGYYDYPRSINVHQLAKKASLSYSTYQEHLRKAESKVLPNYSGRQSRL